MYCEMSDLTEDARYPCTGKGLCIIITNFYGSKSKTQHLPGYVVDHMNLKKYFETTLKYKVITNIGNQPLQNLSSRQFRASLGEIKDFLNGKSKEDKPGNIDRFVMFVLSHGGQAGVCMCEEGSNGERGELDPNGNTVYISVEEIINHFTHDNIPMMEGIPKCFVIQACRGRGYVQPAGPNGGCEENESEMLQKVMENPSIKRANIIVAHATLDKTFSWVDSLSGSWFVTTILKVFGACSKKDDIFGMLTKVIRSFSLRKNQNIFFPVNQADIEICVVHDGRLCPLLVYGKLKTIQDETDRRYSEGKGMPLYPGKDSYTHFAPSRHIYPYLEEYEFSGSVIFRMGQEESLKLQSLSAEKLKAFSDTKYFIIEGILKNQSIGRCTEHAEIVISGDTFEVQKRVRPKCGIKPDNLEIFGHIGDDNDVLDESLLYEKEAQLYFKNELYHVGKLEKCNGIWGIFAPIYQLPIISSTLTKKMYLTEVEQPVTDTVDGLDKVIASLQNLRTQEEAKANKDSTQPKTDQPVDPEPGEAKSHKESTQPKTDLPVDPEPETLPAGAAAAKNEEASENEEKTV